MVARLCAALLLAALPAIAAVTKADAVDEAAPKALVGTLRLTVDPEDVEVAIDGELLPGGATRVVPLLAGRRTVRATLRGFEDVEIDVDVPAGGEVVLALELVPNSRSLLVRTEDDGVAVFVDGVSAGQTRREAGSAGPAELLLPDVALGEHVLELRKPCHRSETIRDLVAVSLSDRSPKVYGPVYLEPVRAKLRLTGVPEGGTVLVNSVLTALDGSGSGEVCPGRCDVEVRAAGRAVFRATVDAVEGTELALAVAFRPNAVLVGLEEWPVELRSWGESLSTWTAAAPAGFDASSPDAWRKLALRPDADLALAAGGAGGGWFLHSPVLETLERIAAPRTIDRPSWTRSLAGIVLADSRTRGRAVIVDLVPGSGAALAELRIGEQVTAVGGKPVTGAADADAAIAGAPAGALVLSVTGVAGEQRDVTVQLASSLSVAGPRDTPPLPAIRAAWARADMFFGGPAAPAAAANLGALLSRHGRDAESAAAWRRADFGERAGVGQGTRDYFLGVALLRSGEFLEAARALTAAARSTSRALHDEGPPVAPAARDRLRELGLVPAAAAPTAR